MKNISFLSWRLVASVTTTLFLSSCAPLQPISSSQAIMDYHSHLTDVLRSLPPPHEPIVVAVYKFRDQTGQYKGSDSIMQNSTAVTQGATSMLVRALLEAGNGKWFTVLEREGLPDLLNERKIINQTREMYAKDLQNQGLPPLLYAPILLQGGIIAYENNSLTGGMGLHYLGMGGSTEMRKDTVTTMLRTVSVKNGQVLSNVDARKTILSVQLDSGAFRYVAFKSLLEAEAGVTSNEPPQMAVMESIETCVYSTIMDGVINKLWSFEDKEQQEIWLKKYENEMKAQANEDSETETDTLEGKPVKKEIQPDPKPAPPAPVQKVAAPAAVQPAPNARVTPVATPTAATPVKAPSKVDTSKVTSQPPVVDATASKTDEKPKQKNAVKHKQGALDNKQTSKPKHHQQRRERHERSPHKKLTSKQEQPVHKTHKIAPKKAIPLCRK